MDRAGDVVGMRWLELVVSVGGVMGEVGEGPCKYVGKRGRTPINDVFVEEEIDS